MRPRLLRLGLLALCAASRALGVETVLLGDRFVDNERATQTLPRTAKWFYAGQSGAAERLWVTPPGGGGELRMIANGSAASMALAYFTAAGAPKVLAAGESLALEFLVKLDALKDADSNLRVMLFNSLASRPTVDSEAGTSDAALYANTHSGYQIVLNTGAPAADSFNVHERNNQGNSSPFSLGARLGADNLAALNLKVKQAFAVRLKITRSAGAGTSVTVEATVNGAIVSRTDSSSLLTSFDGCGFYLSGGALGSEQALMVDNLTVKHTTAAAVTTTLLDDTFTDNDRTNQALPGSAKWFYAGQSDAAARLTTDPPTSAGNLVFTPGGADAMAFAYFTPSGSPQTLAVGESLTFQANVHLDVLANAQDGIRFGLFNSGAQRVGADSETGVEAAAFNGYLGYSVWLNPGASGGFNIYRRGAAGPSLFGTSTNALMPASNVADLALTTSVQMIPRFSMTITRLSSGLQIDAAINGRSLIRTETTAATTSFDTLAFFISGAALYDGPQAVFDTVNVIHSSAIPTVPSIGKIISQPFDSGTAWAGAVFEGTLATGAVSAGTTGTINVLGRVLASAGRKLDVNSAGLTGTWSGALNSGLIAVTNTETNLGKLTLAFDLRASAARAVRVRIESADAGGVVGGALERTIHPAVAGSFQRYAFELADMTPVSGAFSPTAPHVKLIFQIEGGVDAGSWPAGTHSLQIDNVHYSRPAYYVKPTGSNSLDGRTEANAFATIAKALTVADAGDIVLVMEGASSPAFNLTSGLSFARGGTPAGWVTLKNYPGQRPLIKRLEPTGGSYNLVSITGPGFNDASFDYTTNLNYIEVRGLRFTGTADTLPLADRGGSTAKSNLNGLAVSGRFMVKTPHHIRFADNEIFNISAGGVVAIDADWWFVENNDIHDTSNWTIYATSGISSLTPANFDGTAGGYRHFWLGNRVYRNETKIAWEEIGVISDGNGAILDTFLDTRHGPYLGRSIVANNLLYENGGSGVHAFKVNGADIVNNTVVRNSHSPALEYPNVFGNSSNDLLIANNVIVAAANEPLNNSGYSTAFPRTSGVTFLHNIYLSDGATVAPYAEANDAGNVITSDVKFVDAAVGDFRLRTGSPAFDAALVLNMTPVRDFHGILRRTDGLPDIGACERQPAIVAPPLTQTRVVGNGVTLSVAAQSAGPNAALTYQWQRNGANLAGATGPQLTLANLTTAQAGDYRAVVSTPFDIVASPAATLTVWTQLQNWRNTNFGTSSNVGLAADTADPDQDGLFNLVEYSLSLFPNTPSRAGTPTFSRNGSGRLTLTFLRARGDVTYAVEGTADFSGWTTIATNPGSVGELVTVTDGEDTPRRFLRLRITHP